jgi:HK97 family phage portal protein
VTILNRAVRNAAAMMRSAEWGDSSIPPPGSGAWGGSGKQVGIEAAALSISTVLACVKALHDDMKTLPFSAYTGDRNGPRSPLRVQPDIIVSPFGTELTLHAGIGQIVVSLAMRGKAFLYVVSRDPNTGLPTQLLVLHPDMVRPRMKGGRKIYVIGATELGADEIIHLTAMMMPGAIDGVDVLTAQRTNLELAQKVGQYAEGFFGNGGSPAGVIQVPGGGDRTKARQVKEGWEDAHTGVQNAHRPAVLFGGAEWKPMTVTPENAQFLETRRYLREEICGLFGVPLQRIQAITDNASQGGGAGLDALDAQYVKHTLLPIATTIEAVWDRMIPGEEHTWALFDLDVFLRANAKGRADIRQINRVTATRTIDEERAAEGWAPLPDGQGENPFTPLNSNASPTGGTDNAPKPGGEGDPS